MSAELASRIRDKAAALGFDGVAFAPARLDEAAKRNLAEYVRRRYHGDMAWMAETLARRGDPQALWPAARSVIMLAMNYAPKGDPLFLVPRPERGNISIYARGQDYHDLVKRQLKALAQWLAESSGGAVKVFVDTAPVMEKPLAQAAGLGWQGKHTNLVSRDHGSWLFLGSIFTTLELPADAPEADHCGHCRRCLDACPTQAFPRPYRIDARRCISYLTIEHKGHIPREFREPMGNRIYGCDDCLAACPWNKFARRTRHYAFLPRVELTAPKLADLVSLDDAGFRQVFAGSPIKRIGRDRFIRNVLIAIGNSSDARLACRVETLLDDPSPLVRAMAVWALARLVDERRFIQLKCQHLPGEDDFDVRGEWESAAPQAGAGFGTPEAASLKVASGRA
ncbi:MAG TPA: tRNA epoxyqueuosine(34) reductase QueG [Alphaproteobacteria bacterium]|nr:tRNA epoxyqueuosine(34) reductase QueG [Alphaproteobacteria bacterium]